GIRIVMATGDRDAPAQAVAQACGITEVYAEMTPPGKYALLERLRDEGRRVLMVGDGLNDAPVLAGAQVSMAPGSALDMAQKASDIVFMGDLFAPVYTAYRTGARAQRLVWENFMLAGLYNAIAIPLAFMGLVTPFVAAIAMSASSVAVIVNSFRLRWRA
ncbi:MAG: HAD-IC family P-type ATPase, partial [Alphaproteobacteria bacterium]|nr:HAD-IC family P-type ATPase [Alphaproteobacteria bacterium]